MGTKMRRREMEELSESILHHILSFLNYTDVVRASAVSRAWRNAVSTLHCLNVTDGWIRPLNASRNLSGLSAVELKNHRKEKVRLMLISAGCFIVKAKEQNLDINQFSFKFRGKFSYFLPYLMQCVKFMGMENVRVFVLDVGTGGRLSYYSLPVSVYVVHSLQKLVVGGLKLSLAGVHRINLPSLKELDLGCCQIDDEFFEQLIMNCPLLEIMKIADCFGFHSFKVLGSHQKLKWIELMKDEENEDLYSYAPQEIQKIEVNEAPKLDYFRYWSNDEDVLRTLDLSACVNLKVLKLTSLRGDDKLFESVEHLVSHLNVLEAFMLHLFSWLHSDKELKSMKISSNSFRDLWLGFANDPVDVRVDAPRLSKFFYLGFTSSNFSFRTSSIKDANFVKCDEDIIAYYDRFVEFLRTFNHIESVKLDDFATHEFPEPKILGNLVDPPLWGIKHLTVGARYSENKYVPIDLAMLESLLWMAPQLDTLTFLIDLKSGITFQFIHGNRENNVVEVPYISQRNTVVKVKVESCKGTAEGLELKKYCFDGEISLEFGITQRQVQVMSKCCGD